MPSCRRMDRTKEKEEEEQRYLSRQIAKGKRGSTMGKCKAKGSLYTPQGLHSDYLLRC